MGRDRARFTDNTFTVGPLYEGHLLRHHANTLFYL